MDKAFSLAKAYEKYFRIGAAVSPWQISAHHGLLLQHFNSLTAENEMKYEPTEPEEGRFCFDKADAVIASIHCGSGYVGEVGESLYLLVNLLSQLAGGHHDEAVHRVLGVVSAGQFVKYG